MSGVRVGSRLDQLRALAERVQVAIELAERDEARECALSGRVSPVTIPAIPRQGSSPATPAPSLVHVPVRSVRVDVIRDWANANGYAMTDRGRIPHLVLDEFASAHR